MMGSSLLGAARSENAFWIGGRACQGTQRPLIPGPRRMAPWRVADRPAIATEITLAGATCHPRLVERGGIELGTMVVPKASHIRSSLRTGRVFVPSLVREVWDIFGEGAARRLVEHFGGRKIKPSQRLTADSKLVKALGPHVARWLATRHVGDIAVPRAQHLRYALRDLQAVQLRGAGHSTSEIARKLQVTQRTVYRMLLRVEERHSASIIKGLSRSAARRGHTRPARNCRPKENT